MPDKKIISLLPAATEIVCALGFEQYLVGRSHQCNYPPGIQHLPVCTETQVDSGATSLQIDQQVRGILSNALSVYKVKANVVAELQPDVIITQDQCAACAVSLSDVEKALGDDLGKHVQIISLSPQKLDDIFYNIRQVAGAIGAEQQAEQLIEDYQERLDIVRHKLKFRESKPTVACIEWLDPLMTSGNWIPEMVELAGGIPVLASAGAHSPTIDWVDIQLADPEIIVLMPCGFSIDQTIREIGDLLAKPGFNDLKAVKNNRLYIADGSQYFNRPGPRIVDSVEMLAEMINLKQFIFGLEGEGWIKFGV